MALLASIVLLGRPALAATTLVVDDDGLASLTDCNALTAAFPTITLAIAAAAAGDTIKVCPGVYAEQVQVTKTLTLLGAKAGVDARTRALVVTDESTIDSPCGPVQIMADNVTIDGFTIQGSTLPDPCYLSGIWTNPGFSGTEGGHQILNNIVQNNISGIELDSSCVNPTLVRFNLLKNNNNAGPGSGNAIQTNFGLCSGTIDRNKFSGHMSSSVLVVAASSNLTISSNELVPGTSEGIALLNTTSSTISGNISLGSTSSGTIDLFGGNSGIAVSGNTLANGMRGVWVENPYAVYGVLPNSNISAHTNCISGNTVAGLEVSAGGYSPTPPLDATNNWWGKSSGPMHASNSGGTGDKVIAPDNNVTVVPFVTTAPASPCPQPPPPPPPPSDQGQEDNGHGQQQGQNGQNNNFNFDECDSNQDNNFQDESNNVHFQATKGSASRPTFDTGLAKATTTGKGLNNGKEVTYVLVVTDMGIGADIYSLTLTNSSGVIYTTTGKMISGNIKVRR